MNNPVPFMDLVTPQRQIESELVAVVRQAFETGRFIGGPMVEGFERDFARFCGTAFAAGVGSGTDALRFALLASGVKQGDIVVTVPFTFIATTEAISQAGACPAFVDIDPRTCTMDPGRLEAFLSAQCARDEKTGKTVHVATARTVSAVVPVHLYGQMADMQSILKIAERYGLLVIEDACQAHGAEYWCDREQTWRKAGSAGRAAAFSFYPGKNLGACGEGGAVTTNHEEVDHVVRMLRDHGQVQKYVHSFEGYNGRLDAIQAGILQVKLRQLPAWNEERVQKASVYNQLLADVEGVVLPHVPDWSRPVYHLYVVRVQERDRLQAFLGGRNITTGLHYPIPLHRQKAYESTRGLNGSLPASEDAAREVLSLPLYPGLEKRDQEKVAEAVRAFLSLPATVRRCAHHFCPGQLRVQDAAAS